MWYINDNGFYLQKVSHTYETVEGNLSHTFVLILSISALIVSLLGVSWDTAKEG